MRHILNRLILFFVSAFVLSSAAYSQSIYVNDMDYVLADVKQPFIRKEINNKYQVENILKGFKTLRVNGIRVPIFSGTDCYDKEMFDYFYARAVEEGYLIFGSPAETRGGKVIGINDCPKNEYRDSVAFDEIDNTAHTNNLINTIKAFSAQYPCKWICPFNEDGWKGKVWSAEQMLTIFSSLHNEVNGAELVGPCSMRLNLAITLLFDSETKGIKDYITVATTHNLGYQHELWPDFISLAGELPVWDSEANHNKKYEDKETRLEAAVAAGVDGLVLYLTTGEIDFNTGKVSNTGLSWMNHYIKPEYLYEKYQMGTIIVNCTNCSELITDAKVVFTGAGFNGYVYKDSVMLSNKPSEANYTLQLPKDDYAVKVYLDGVQIGSEWMPLNGNRDKTKTISISKAIKKYGNYTDERIGVVGEEISIGPIFYPDKEFMFDFDTQNPLDGASYNEDEISLNARYYMTKGKSLEWKSEPGSAITFDASILLKDVSGSSFYASVGLFQFEHTTPDSLRGFKFQCLDTHGNVRLEFPMYLHKLGWNVLGQSTGLSFEELYVDSVRIVQTSGAPGTILVDNLMLFNCPNTGHESGIETKGISDSVAVQIRAAKYPATTITQDEIAAFAEISEKILPTPEPIDKVSDWNMGRIRDLYDKLEIESDSMFANGIPPIYYSGINNKYLEQLNKDICYRMRDIGKFYRSTQDEAQKAELAKIMVDIVKLNTTYGGIPIAWYHRGGFGDGLLYCKDLLQEHGLLERAIQQMMVQYEVDKLMYTEHKWEKALEYGKSPDDFWCTKGDDLNTSNKGTMQAILLQPDSPEKARDMYRLKAWMEKIGLNFSPYEEGCLKPDGSFFHHWGNRFGNYGWVGAWRGATEYMYWMNSGPFRLNEETYERMFYMSDIHFNATDSLGYLGYTDDIQVMPSIGYLNLARAGNVGGDLKYDPTNASYWLAYLNDNSYKQNGDIVTEMTTLGYRPKRKENYNWTLSYDILNLHRNENWQLVTRATSNESYYIQYMREGFLFFNMGGLGMRKDGEFTGEVKSYDGNMGQGINPDVVTNGYNFNLAPAVTSVPAAFKDLTSQYYQMGTSDFVGGLSTNNGRGIFTQEMNATSKFSGTPADGIRFKKSYFYFDDNIVLLSSGIAIKTGTDDVQTGILQESTESVDNHLLLSNSTLINDDIDSLYSSSEIPWLLNTSHGVGYYFTGGQNFRVKRGLQSFGPTTGYMTSAHFEHKGQDLNGWYAYILRLNTDENDMNAFVEEMSEKKPKFEILQKDSKAHIVRERDSKTTAYVVFKAEELELPEGLITNIDHQCAAMIENRAGEDLVVLSVSNPNRHFSITPENPLGWSLPTTVNVTLKGEFTINAANNEKVSLRYNNENNTTVATFIVKDGLTEELILNHIKPQNSLPWIEEFPLADNTVVDNGSTTWSVEGDGSAKIMNHSFEFGEGNASWRSGIIDLSGVSAVNISLEASMKNREVAHANDSLKISYSTKDGEWVNIETLSQAVFSKQKIELKDITAEHIQLKIESVVTTSNAGFIIDNVVVEETSIDLSGFELELDAKRYMVGDYVNPTILFNPYNATDTVLDWTFSQENVLREVSADSFLVLKQGNLKLYANHEKGYCDSLEISCAYPVLAEPWVQASVGAAHLCSTSSINNRFEITANGENIGDKKAGDDVDNCHFIYKKLTGNFTISARVSFPDANNLTPFAGIMIRNSLEAQDIMYALLADTNQGYEFNFRASNPGNTVTKSGDVGGTSTWLKFDYDGNRLKYFTSTDGINFDYIRNTQPTFEDTVLVGFAISSSSVSAFSTCLIEDIRINGIALESPAITANNIAIYPNPAKDFVTIESEEGLEHIVMYDLAGRPVYSHYIGGGIRETTIDMSTFKKGIYIVKTTSQTSHQTFTLSLE